MHIMQLHFAIQTTLLLQIELVLHPMNIEEKQKINQGPALNFKNLIYGTA